MMSRSSNFGHVCGDDLGKRKIPLLWEYEILNTGSCCENKNEHEKETKRSEAVMWNKFDCGAENFTWDGSSLSSMIPVRRDES